MEELINKIKEKAGLSDEQAQHTVEAIREYVIEKFPMLEGMVDKLLGAKED